MKVESLFYCKPNQTLRGYFIANLTLPYLTPTFQALPCSQFKPFEASGYIAPQGKTLSNFHLMNCMVVHPLFNATIFFTLVIQSCFKEAAIV